MSRVFGKAAMDNAMRLRHAARISGQAVEERPPTALPGKADHCIESSRNYQVRSINAIQDATVRLVASIARDR